MYFQIFNKRATRYVALKDLVFSIIGVASSRNRNVKCTRVIPNMIEYKQSNAIRYRQLGIAKYIKYMFLFVISSILNKILFLGQATGTALNK